MKKMFLIILAVLILAVGTGACFAEPMTEPFRHCGENLETKIKQVENVRDCKVVCIRGYCFVALRTKGVASKTAMQELTEKVKTVVMDNCPRIQKVFVSTSVKTFAALGKLTRANIWEQLVKLFDLSPGEHPMPDIKPMPYSKPDPAKPQSMDDTEKASVTVWN